MIDTTRIICSHCTGNHHALECPDLRPTLKSIGIHVNRPVAPPMQIEAVPCRPYYSTMRGADSLIQVIMDAELVDQCRPAR